MTNVALDTNSKHCYTRNSATPNKSKNTTSTLIPPKPISSFKLKFDSSELMTSKKHIKYTKTTKQQISVLIFMANSATL